MFRAKANNKSARDLKKGIDKDDSRQKRVEVTVELRKKNRDEQVMKRRNGAGSTNDNSENVIPTANNATVAGSAAKLTQQDVAQKLKNMSELVAGVNSSEQSRQLQAVVDFRRMLSVEKNPPIQQVIDTGVVPKLISLLGCVQNETLQFEAAWTLTNIASGTTEHTQHIINHGAIQAFVVLLTSRNAEVREQAVWALGNIAGDSPRFRDYVIQAGGVQGMLSMFQNDAALSLIRNATWSLSNLCRGKPQPNFELIRDALPLLAKLIMVEDTEVITDATWALSYISDDNGPTNAKIQAVIDQGVIPRLVQCLNHQATTVQVPALRCIGNIVTGDDKQTSAVLSCNALPFLLGLMSHRKKGIKKEACWTVSNITAGNGEQIQRVIEANFIPPLVCMLREETFDIQKEAAWAISNATSGGNSNQIRFLVQNGVIPALCNLFACADPKITMVALEGIENILRSGKKEAAKASVINPFCDAVEECGGLDQLELLQRHDNEEVYDKSVKVLREFFESEEMETTASVPAVDFSKNQFDFGVVGGQNTTFHF